jgi:hypothetical protein
LLDELCPLATPAAPYEPPAYEISQSQAPQAWLYVSKRLDLVLLPNTPLWCSPVVTLGTTVYYRLSPAVAHWLDCAGRALEQKFIDGTCGRDQIDAFCEAMTTVWEFAAANLDPDAVCEAKDSAPELPQVPEFSPLTL